MGFSRHEHWSGLPCPPPGDLPNPGNELMSLIPPVLAGGFFTTSSTWEATVLSVQFSSVAQLYRLFVTPWTVAPQASLSVTNSLSLLKTHVHLTLCRPLLLLPSICPSIRVFSNLLALCIRWPKYWNLSFSWRLTHVIAKAFRFCIQSSNSPAYQLSGLGQVS